MKYPLLPLFCAYALGVIMQVYVPLPASGWGLFLFGSLPLLWLLKNKPVAQCCFFLVTGGGITGWHTTYLPPNDLQLILPSDPMFASIRGTIVQSPEERAYQVGQQVATRTLTRIQVAEVKTNELWVPAAGTMMVIHRGKLPGHFFRKQQVEIDGIVKTPPPAPAPNMFDYRKYLRWQGVHFQLETEIEKQWNLHGNHVIPEPLSEQFRKWAYNVLGRGLPEESEALQLLRALVLGWRANLAGEISAPFMKTGTMHVFAISGLHITGIAMLLVWGIPWRRIGVSTRTLTVIIIPLLWFYTYATGMQASAVRASMMSTTLMFAYIVERPNSWINALAAAALLILIYEPLQLFQASFQLSFSVVLVILLMVPWTERLPELFKQNVVDPYLPEELVTPLHRWRIWFLKKSVLPVAITIGTWIGSLPLVLHYFNLLTPSSLLVNLLVVPLTTVALMVSILNLLFLQVYEPLSVFCNWISWWCMELATQTATSVAGWPLSHLYLPKPSLTFFLLFYGLVMAWLLDLQMRTRKIATVVLTLSLAGYFALQGYQSKRLARLAILPVQGAPIYVDQPGLKNDLLVDCSRHHEARNFLPRYFHAQGVNTIPAVLLTHGDVSHIEGFEELSKEFGFTRVYASPVNFRSPPYRQLLRSIPFSSLYTNAYDSSRINDFSVLHPAKSAKGSKADDLVVVLHGTLNGTSILLLGDLSRKGQLDLMAAHPHLTAEVVISSISNPEETIHPDLFAHLKPSLLIINSTGFPASARATPELRKRLAGYGVHTLYTEDLGAIHLDFRKDEFEVRTSAGKFQPVVTETREGKITSLPQ